MLFGQLENMFHPVLSPQLPPSLESLKPVDHLASATVVKGISSNVSSNTATNGGGFALEGQSSMEDFFINSNNSSIIISSS